MLLAEKTAIVTGAGRGIGEAIAKRFASEGAAVLVTARTEEEIRQIASQIETAGGRAVAVAADVSQEAGCEKIVRAARESFGAIHVLVNNAGIYGPVQAVERISAQEWDQVMAVNLRSAFLLSRLVLPEMYERGEGTIINVTSAAAKAAFPMNSPYAASKAGLIGLTHTLAAEAARKGVRVNAISPGPVPGTKMSAELGRRLGAIYKMSDEEMTQRMGQSTLQGRPQTPEEIASAAVFLASSQASAITGQTLNVDGGIAFY